MFNILKHYKLWLIISGFLVMLSVISLFLFKLKLGIDFTGGSIIELRFEKPVERELVRKVLVEQKLEGFRIQSTENFGLIIKTKFLTKAELDNLSVIIAERGEIHSVQRFESIGPTIGAELKQKAFYQLLLVSLGILLYIGYAFRKVAKPITSWKFSIAAIVALFHDLLLVLGIFAILGKFKGIEIDSMFVTAVLTVMGFSVHDTIVVFDRIRENLKTYAGQSMEYITNKSIGQTIVRSLNTSITVLFVLLALILFGGESIKYFVITLFIGVIIGTYSSIFIASPILILLQKKRKKT